MSWLLDTHVVLWWLTDDASLTDEVKEILDADTEVFLSTVSIWEIVIKQAIGKLDGPVDLAERTRRCGFQDLEIRADHAIEVAALPMLHRDPFDRMLIAQARREGLTIISRDGNIRRYPVRVLVA